MSHIMLPKVKTQGFESPTVGTWTPYNLEFLDKLTKSMEVQGVNSQNGNVSSIPDVWAKPILFETLLFGDNEDADRMAAFDGGDSGFSSTLRERVIGEWRCVLAMLALSKVKHLDITAESVELSSSGKLLEDVLYNMRPSKSIDPGTQWSDLYILSYKGRPFAMTSPTTLVSVSADYSNVMRGVFGVPWAVEYSAGVVMVDPTPGLSVKDRKQLYFWLLNLKKNLKENASGDSVTLSKLINCVDKFAKDVKGEQNFKEDCRFTSQELKMYKGIFKYLDTPVLEEDVKADESYVKIAPASGKMPEKLWLLVDSKSLNRMSTEWDIDKNLITVWSGLSANNITDDMLVEGRRDYIGSAQLVGAEWVKADDFFTEHVYVLSDLPQVFTNVFDPGATDKGVQDNEFSIVPPINKRVLDYFSMEEIRRRFHLRFEDSGDIVASFDLPFVYTDESGREVERMPFKVEKRYSENDEEHCCFQEYVPMAELWPNKRLESWNKYYFCYINQFSGGKTEVMENFLLLTPWSSSRGEMDYQGNQIDCLSNKYTVQLDAFPEAMICSALWKTEGYSPKKVDVGLLLIDPPELLEHRADRVWNVGVDFGTSNTMLYYQAGGKSAPKPLTLEPNLYPLTKQKTGERAAYLIANFVWPEEKLRNGSFLTIYNVIRRKDDKMAKVEPLIDGNIFSLTSDKLSNLGSMSRNMVPNLKWASEGSSGENVTRKQKLAEAYIEQICMQTAFEAAKDGAENIGWNFSYPTAFSSEEKKFFARMTNDAVKNAMKATPYETKEKKINTLREESVATATYFNKLDGQASNFVDGAICLDIGAGTTDISIISADPTPHISYHASAQYAGRIFFSAVFAWLEHFLEPRDRDELQKESDPDKKRAMLDSIMRDKSDEYLQKVNGLLVGGGDNTRIVTSMLQIPQLAMTGLFYYTGIVLRLLREYEIFDRDVVPDIYVGGNGSRIFHWIEGAVDEHDPDDKHLKVLRRAILASSGLEDDGFAIHLSPRPKMEVAAGMLVKEDSTDWFNERRINRMLFGDDPDEYTLNSLVAGESFEVGDETVDAYEFMNAHDIKDKVRVSKLPYIEDMVSVFNSRTGDIWGKAIDITKFGRDLRKNTSGYFANEQVKDIDNIHVEPVFLVAMKVLIDKLNGELSKDLGAEEK